MNAGLKTKTVDAKIIEFEYLGTKREALLINPYGLMSNAPNDSLIITFSQDGNKDSKMGFPTDPENNDTLELKEVAVGVPTLKARIKFDKEGNIIATGQDEKSIIKLDKDGNINKNLEKDYSITGKGKYTGSFKDEVEISGEKKISLKAKQNIEITTEQKILIKNTAENLKDLIDALINTFNSLPSSTEQASGHSHSITYTALTTQLTIIKNRFGTLFTS